MPSMMPPAKMRSRLAWTMYTAMTEKRWRSEYKDGSATPSMATPALTGDPGVATEDEPAMRSTGQPDFFSARSAAFRASSLSEIPNSTFVGNAEQKCESVLRYGRV